MKFPALLLAPLLLLAACGPAPRFEADAKQVAASFAGQNAPAAEPSADGTPYETQKQVKTGSLTLETSDLPAAEKTLTDRVTAAGGFVEHASSTTEARSLTLRLPAAKFDAFLGGLGTVGKVTAQQVDVADVTVQYFDLETRLKNQRLLLDQYRGFLSQTKKMDEILTAMAKISELTTQIESTEGQFRYLGRQVDLATLQVELTLPFLAQGRSWPDLGESFADLVHGLAEFGVGALVFVVGALVVVPVLGALVVLVVWLWLGRPGLWRRLKSLRNGAPGVTAPNDPAGTK